MINVVQAGPTGFDYAIFGEQSPVNTSYFQQQLSYFSESLNDLGRKFMQGAQEVYDKINNNEALRYARAALRTVRGIFHPNAVVSLESIEDLRSAQPMMQRYIMAEPTLRQQYNRQLIDGYSSTYVDMDVGCMAENHYDYRRVMTGVIQDVQDDSGEDHWVAKQFYDEARDDERDLTHDERVSILKTWEIVKMFTEAGKDVTDIFAKD